MIIVAALIGLILGFAAGVCVAFGVNYALGLRRQLKAAQDALAQREEVKVSQVPNAPKMPDDEPQSKPDTPIFSGIGPTDIGNRELYEQQQADKISRPPFTRGALNITEAANEAARNGGG